MPPPNLPEDDVIIGEDDLVLLVSFRHILETGEAIPEEGGYTTLDMGENNLVTKAIEEISAELIRDIKGPAADPSSPLGQLQELLKDPDWDLNDRVRYEALLSQEISRRAALRPEFANYRTPRDNNDVQPVRNMNDFVPGADTANLEWDCDKMSAMEGCIMQLVEDDVLDGENDDYKRPIEYYLTLGSRVDTGNPQPHDGYHAWVTSPLTGAAIEFVIGGDKSVYRFPLEEDAFEKFINGEPLPYLPVRINEDGHIVRNEHYEGRYEDIEIFFAGSWENLPPEIVGPNGEGATVLDWRESFREGRELASEAELPMRQADPEKLAEARERVAEQRSQLEDAQQRVEAALERFEATQTDPPEATAEEFENSEIRGIRISSVDIGDTIDIIPRPNRIPMPSHESWEDELRESMRQKAEEQKAEQLEEIDTQLEDLERRIKIAQDFLEHHEDAARAQQDRTDEAADSGDTIEELRRLRQELGLPPEGDISFAPSPSESATKQAEQLLKLIEEYEQLLEERQAVENGNTLDSEDQNPEEIQPLERVFPVEESFPIERGRIIDAIDGAQDKILPNNNCQYNAFQHQQLIVPEVANREMSNLADVFQFEVSGEGTIAVNGQELIEHQIENAIEALNQISATEIERAKDMIEDISRSNSTTVTPK